MVRDGYISQKVVEKKKSKARNKKKIKNKPRQKRHETVPPGRK
jgi:hypothetical protein